MARAAVKQLCCDAFEKDSDVKRAKTIVSMGFALVLAASGAAWAGQHSDGTRAFARGHYVSEAKKTFSLAERGDAQAQALLGFMYEHGRGVPQDHFLAVHWYTCAAEQGHPTAQYLLGLMYDKGHGVEQSDMLAYKWLNLATAHTAPRTREYYLRIRDAIAAKLDAAQIAEAQWLASRFVPKALR